MCICNHIEKRQFVKKEEETTWDRDVCRDSRRLGKHIAGRGKDCQPNRMEMGDMASITGLSARRFGQTSPVVHCLLTTITLEHCPLNGPDFEVRREKDGKLKETERALSRGVANVVGIIGTHLSW